MRFSRALTIATATTAGALLLAGCGSSGGGSTTSNAGTATATGTTGSAASAAPTAAQIVAKFKTAKLPVGTTLTYTAANDPDHLLGRPNGYLSKTAWTDTRIGPNQVADSSSGSVDLGGSVEVYATASAAQAREDYIQSILKNAPALGTEYDFVVGDALVRVSSALTPAQAQAYKAAA